MGDDERSAIAETIVEIDRAMPHQSPGEQERLMRRRLALAAILRAGTRHPNDPPEPPGKR
jgi:hypothetical protein